METLVHCRFGTDSKCNIALKLIIGKLLVCLPSVYGNANLLSLSELLSRPVAPLDMVFMVYTDWYNAQ